MQFDIFKDRPVYCAGVGEVLFDVFPNNTTLGGAPANFAYYCSQMGFSSVIISAVGNDEYGEKAREILATNYMPALLNTVDYKTGLVHINVDPNGIPEYSFTNNTAYDNIPITNSLETIAHKTNIACFGTLAQRSEKSRKSILFFLNSMPKDLGIRIFDVNLRQNYYSKDIIKTSLAHCEVVKCNADELTTLAKFADLANISPEFYYNYLKTNYNINLFIYTNGHKESIIFFNDNYSALPPDKVEVVDTVGAGDSFGAAVVGALLKGMQLRAAHAFANKVAAFVCSNEGAMAPFPEYLKLK